jgi:2-aminobenzoate-CoA ligase
MRPPSGPTAHVDHFVSDRLPGSAIAPEVLWDAELLPYPDRLNCGAELLDEQVAAGRGDRPCLIDAAGTVLTYADVLERANRLASVLTDGHGLVPGNRVLLRGPNCPWLAVCWLAVQKAGLVAVATMPLLRAGELAAVIERGQVNLALCDSRYLDELLAVATTTTTAAMPAGVAVVAFGPGTELESAMDAATGRFTNCDTAADDPCLIAFTSGTTGQPKGCVHLHRDVLAIADTFSAHYICPTEDDVFIGSPPLAFTFGLGGLVVFPLRAGASAVLLEAASPPLLAEAIERHRATVVLTAPTAYRAMLDRVAGLDLSSLRVAVSAGEPLPRGTRQRFQDATGLRLVDGLGATEMLHVFIAAKGDDIREGAIGTAVPGFVVTVIDEAGSELPPGAIGRLAVKGPTGCRYLDDARQTNYVQRGWNLPGDSVLRDEDGYIWYQARADDMIISAGYNIAGPEVEGALLTHDAVAECACVGVPDEERGMLVKAFVVPREGVVASAELAAELQAHVKATIAPYKYPRLIEFRTELPKTATGKLQRFKLREAD